jgi:hypothetical protein
MRHGGGGDRYFVRRNANSFTVFGLAVIPCKITPFLTPFSEPAGSAGECPGAGLTVAEPVEATRDRGDWPGDSGAEGRRMKNVPATPAFGRGTGRMNRHYSALWMVFIRPVPARVNPQPRFDKLSGRHPEPAVAEPVEASRGRSYGLARLLSLPKHRGAQNFPVNPLPIVKKLLHL